MLNKKKLKNAVNTLLYAWGGDTPPEAIWAFNELMEALNMKASIEDEENTESGYNDFKKELESHIL